MATQHQLTFEAITGLRRTTGRDFLSSDSDDAIQRPTNRGNKLKRKAEYVHEGQLDRPNGLKVYKKSITHGGFERAILRRNPKRYDIDGDELDDEDIDEAADADAAARNPYSHIKLEELLAPLTSAADLPQHPSLSIPYLSDTLTSMTRQACTMLHREKRSLYAVKNLLTKFRGDNAFIPCGSLNSDFDQHIFDIKPVYGNLASVKLQIHPLESPTISPRGPQKLGGSSGLVSGASLHESSDIVDGLALEMHERIRLDLSTATGNTETEQEIAGIQGSEYTDYRATDVAMADVLATKEHSTSMATKGIETRDTAVGTDATVEEVAALNEEQEHRLNVSPLPLSPQQDARARTPSTAAIGLNDVPSEETSADSPKDRALPSPESLKDEPRIDVIDDRRDTLPTTANEMNTEGAEAKATEDAEGEEVGDESQSVPRRMRTRAQAQAASDKSASHTRTPSPASWVPPVIHPLYLMPESARPDRDYGLPPVEAEDTRRLLTAFVQKQEEVVRGAERLYEGLLRADRMRQTVFKWCKAEGHIGEMSDGEDWYDKEEWGLDEDLKKGQGDEEEDTTTQGKKSRKTRQHQ